MARVMVVIAIAARSIPIVPIRKLKFTIVQHRRRLAALRAYANAVQVARAVLAEMMVVEARAETVVATRAAVRVANAFRTPGHAQQITTTFSMVVTAIAVWWIPTVLIRLSLFTTVATGKLATLLGRA
jgi:hypothetical protein